MAHGEVSPQKGGKKRNLDAAAGGDEEEHETRKAKNGHDDTDSDISMSEFRQILHDAGLSMPKGGAYTAVSAALVSHQLKRKLQHSPTSVEDFLKGLEDHLEDESQLRASLLPIIVASAQQTQSVAQDPLIKLLLGVPDIQPRLIQMLFDKIPTFFDDDREDHKASESIPRLILAQLRWMEYTCDESEITQKLIDLIEIAPLHLQREIITALPDIIQDKDLVQVVECLENVIESNCECINSVLDALSSFSLEPDQLVRVTEKIVVLLDSADPEDLPVMVRYLLQSTGDKHLKEVVKSLRNSISFISSSDDDANLVRFSQAAHCRRGEGKMLTLEAIRSGIKFRKIVSSVLVQEIVSVDKADDHMPFDIWALVLIRSTGDSKRQGEVDRVFRAKVRSNLFQHSLIYNSLFRHADALKPYFKEFRALAHQFLRSHDMQLSAFGSKLYTLIFKVFLDDCSRQEVLSDVMTHIGAGQTMEVGAALSVLDSLVDEDCSLLRPFGAYIKSILEYLDNLVTKEHIRILFRIVSKVSVSAPTEGSTDYRLDDEVHNKITKLLQIPERKYFQLGVIGALSAVVVLSTKSNSDLESAETESCDDQDQIRDSQATSLLDTIKANCEHSAMATIFMCDEMAAIFAAAHARGVGIKQGTLRWVEKFTEDFDNIFLADVEDDSPVSGIAGIHSSMKVMNDMNLNGDQQLVCLNLFPMIESGSEMPQKLCASFRLLGAYQIAATGSMDGVDALLGCPIFMIENCPIEEFDLLQDNVKADYTVSHFYTSNWIIELLHAFSFLEEPDGRAKAVQRANHLWNLLSILDKCLNVRPMCLPNLNASSAVGETQSFKASGKPKTAMGVSKAANSQSAKKGKASKKRNGKKEKKAADMNIEEDSDGHDPSATAGNTASRQIVTERKDPVPVKKQAGYLAEFVNLREHAHCFRPIEFDVHRVLQYDHQMRLEHSQGTLQPNSLLSLLRDLNSKLEDVLAAQRKASHFIPTKVSKEDTVTDISAFMKVLLGLCPALVYHFKTTATIFKKGSPNLVPSLEDEETLLVVLSIIQKILTCPDSLISISDPSSPIAKVVKCLAEECPSQLEHDGQDGMVEDESMLEAHAMRAVKFLETFARDLPSLKLTSTLCSLMTKVAGIVNRKEVNATCSNFALWCLQQGRFEDAPNEPKKIFKQKDETELQKVQRRDAMLAWKESQMAAKEALNTLVITHVSLAPRPFECMEVMYKDVLSNMQPADEEKKSRKKRKCEESEEEEEEDHGGRVEGFPMISCEQFVPFYDILMEYTSEQMVALDNQSFGQVKFKDISENVLDFIDSLSEIVTAFKNLVSLTKIWEKPAVLSSTLKCGNRMLTSFLRIMAVLGKFLTEHQKAITDVVFKFQKATRALQHICAHGKMEKEQKMVEIVPKLKKNLELLLFKVKGMLVENGMGQAFWLGTLKHRTLQGQACEPESESESESEVQIEDAGDGDDNDISGREEADDGEVDDEEGGEEGPQYNVEEDTEVEEDLDEHDVSNSD